MKITWLLSSRFWSASLPELSRISTFLGCLVTPARAGSAKSSVFPSGEPSTGQNTPQNFCLGLGGLWRNGGAAPVVDMPLVVAARSRAGGDKREESAGLDPPPPTRSADGHATKLIRLQPPHPPCGGRPGSLTQQAEGGGYFLDSLTGRVRAALWVPERLTESPGTCL